MVIFIKTILFVIDSLQVGGAEKSLISLLNNIDYSKYKIDILMFKRGGELEKFLPSKVNVLNLPRYFKFLDGDIKGIKKEKLFKYMICRYKASLNLRIYKNRMHSEQIVYDSIKNVLDVIDNNYDVAIAYSQGFPTYFVSEKVKSRKKMAWINCDYARTLYDKDKDSIFYKSIDNIVVVSDYVYNSVATMKYNYKEKMSIIFDIVDSQLIKKLSKDEVKEIEYLNFNGLKILTVGRLAKVKGYDLAIKSAKILKESGVDFKWFVIGEGEERLNIERLVEEYKLKDNFILLGSKFNPYKYIRQCDMYVQTSRKEGFGLSIIEAKILKKISIITNFETAKYLINNNVDGLIVEQNPSSIANAIKKILRDKSLMENLKKNILNEDEYNTKKEIEKIYQLINFRSENETDFC